MCYPIPAFEAWQPFFRLTTIIKVSNIAGLDVFSGTRQRFVCDACQQMKSGQNPDEF
jgi:hypothetical protein